MNQTVVFDRFSIDRASRRLYSGETPIPLSTPGIRLLLALVESNGALVTKDQLLTLVWGASPVSENTLHSQVSELRRAIGNHLIITQSGIGYRFVGKLGPSPPETRQAAPPRLRRSSAPTALVGREAVLNDLASSLRRSRFVTLTGPGGVGKTSLATALAERVAPQYPDGVHLVELAAQRDQSGVADAVKVALKIIGQAGESSMADVSAYLQSRKTLLVLDNCEHLLLAVAGMAETLFAGSPDLAIIATSRQALACAQEKVFVIPTLPVPDADVDTMKKARRFGAFRLFTDRLAFHDPHFVFADEHAPTIARICRSLDGLPLALELVAGWVGVLGLETIEEKLNTAPFSWAHASRTMPARHHDLRTALEWSHALLSKSEQALLRRVAVFAQDFSLAAAEAVAAGSDIDGEVFTHLVSLVKKSLVSVARNTRRTTYQLLETTKAFALEKLGAAGEDDPIHRAHAAYLLREMTQAETAWESSSSESWLGRYGCLINDVTCALDWAGGQAAHNELRLALISVSWLLWREGSLRLEGVRRLEEARQALAPETPLHVQAQLHLGIGMMLCDSQPDVALPAFINAARLYRQLGDHRRLATVLLSVGFARFVLGDVGGAEEASAEGRHLLEGTGMQRWRAAALDLDLALHMHHGRYEEAREAGRQAVMIFEAMGAVRSALTSCCNALEIALLTEDFTTAVTQGRALAARAKACRHGGILVFILVNLVAGLVRGGAFDEASQTAREALPLMAGFKPSFVLIQHLALGCALQERLADAAMLAGFVNRIYDVRGCTRQLVERRAAEALDQILRRSLPEQTLQGLVRTGALLDEAAACAIAMKPADQALRSMAGEAAAIMDVV